MSVEYKDYYEILGLKRDAPPEEVQRAYRKLARQYHPDVNSDPQAEDKFKEINEAHEVLHDPEKRKRYDSLGSHWTPGEDFSPPPGSENVRFEFRSDSDGRTSSFDTFGSFAERGFSDFFESLFGGSDFRSFRTSGSEAPKYQAHQWVERGRDIEAEMEITLEETYRGATRRFEIQVLDVNQSGQLEPRKKQIEVKIPQKTREGARIRLAGQGGKGVGGGPSGDLYIRIHMAPHPFFSVHEYDLETELPISPWEAALGTEIRVPTLDGPVNLRVPPGTGSGQRLRLRGKGLHKKAGGRGDQYACMKIVVPKELTTEEREAFEKLARVSKYTPRQK